MWGPWLTAHTFHLWTCSRKCKWPQEHPHLQGHRIQVTGDCHLARSHTSTNDVCSKACWEQRRELAVAPAAVICVAQKTHRARGLCDRMWSEGRDGRRRRHCLWRPST